MTWDSVPSSSLPLATVGDVLGEGFANRVWRAELDGKSVAVKARKDDLHWWMDFMTRDQRFAHEVDGASNLHTYLDGPAATVVRFEDNGRMRVGLALDLVEGHSLKQFIAGEATDFPITQAHVASIEQMFAKLDAQGAWLEDLHDGQIMLRKDGSVTPIDMRVEPLGDGNPMVLEYARRRAGVLDSLREIARQN